MGISPKKGPAGTLLTIAGLTFHYEVAFALFYWFNIFITGMNFSGNMCEYDVQIGSSYHCPIINMSSTEIRCEITVRSMLNATMSQIVRVARHRQGYLGKQFQFQFLASISNISPMIGRDSFLSKRNKFRPIILS